jgi:hypothetical protein
LDETSGANKLIALKDTAWYLAKQRSSRRTVTLLFRVAFIPFGTQESP